MPLKIFAIGLSKTGTFSLHIALKTLGFSSVHYPISWSEIDQHDASSDITVASRFKELDGLYPGSKFVLTVRDLNQWLESCKKHFTYFTKENFLPRTREFYLQERLKTYGTKIYDASLFEEAYKKHLWDVQSYFAPRPQDFLIMNIPAGDGWKELCSFLDLPILQEPFPHKNAESELTSNVSGQNAYQLRIENLLENQIDSLHFPSLSVAN